MSKEEQGASQGNGASGRATHEPSPDGLGHAVSVPDAWRCFHCGDVLETHEAAAEHFGDGNYEGEMPVCIEAATSEMRHLVLTNREMFRELSKAREEAETAEWQSHCWEQAARMFLGRPNASWHDLAGHRDELEGRMLAAETAINAAPRWLANWLRRRAERCWHRTQAIEARESAAPKGCGE